MLARAIQKVSGSFGYIIPSFIFCLWWLWGHCGDISEAFMMLIIFTLPIQTLLHFPFQVFLLLVIWKFSCHFITKCIAKPEIKSCDGSSMFFKLVSVRPKLLQILLLIRESKIDHCSPKSLSRTVNPLKKSIVDQVIFL